MKMSLESIEIDTIDHELLLLFSRGCTSSYSAWMTMTDNAKKNLRSQRVLAYQNIHQRSINLFKLGLLEEMKLNTVNIHRRRDFRLTLNGLEQISCHILNHPEELEELVQYMNRYKLNKKAFGTLLHNKIISALNTVNFYLGSITNMEPLTIDQNEMNRIQKTMKSLDARIMTLLQTTKMNTVQITDTVQTTDSIDQPIKSKEEQQHIISKTHKSGKQK